ncbi:hypothetical protein B0H14DRAFT_2554139 [Mycena olivaceomarginata]|nr:hypothetical protein B0H14DRAFT_2554139 [Mycena olivaceomarginata]
MQLRRKQCISGCGLRLRSTGVLCSVFAFAESRERMEKRGSSSGVASKETFRRQQATPQEVSDIPKPKSVGGARPQEASDAQAIEVEPKFGESGAREEPTYRQRRKKALDHTQRMTHKPEKMVLLSASQKASPDCEILFGTVPPRFASPT